MASRAPLGAGPTDEKPMAYNYLLELYEIIDRRRQEARGALEAATGAACERQRGRIDALGEIDQFLKTNYHLKLPRRIRSRLDGAAQID